MGGIVARHAVTRLTTPLVPAIITMSTPHLIPPVTFERGMQDIYDDIEVFWRDAFSNESTVGEHIPHSVPPVLVSICGGTADTQISSDSCALQPTPKILDTGEKSPTDSFDNGTFAVFTTGMEGVWTGVDHQAMVWCDQVRRVVATTLLDMSVTTHDHTSRQALQMRKELTQIARRRLLGERTLEEMKGVDLDLHHFTRLDHNTITPEDPTFRHPGSGPSVFMVNVPRDATRFQIIGNMRLNGVGRKGGSTMAIYLGRADSRFPAQYRALPLTELRILPKSAGQMDKGTQRESFPAQGEGVKNEDLMTYAEADLPPADYEREIVLQLTDAAWGSIALIGGDNQTCKY